VTGAIQEDTGIEAFLEIRDVSKHFPVRGRALDTEAPRVLRAVDRVSLALYKGETLGLVGESGCGKSTLARMVVRLLRPTSGAVLLQGGDVWSPALRKELPRRVQMIFQDPFSSLNPRQKVGNAIAEGPRIHKTPPTARGRKERVLELLESVGLGAEYAGRYPHEFSGGQRQRIAIARALALNPELLVCDEPVSALDVSIQAQVLNLLAALQQKLGLTYLFISHDLSVVSHMADRVAVMYLGRVVELAPSADLYKKPLHPYTKALLAALPVPDPVAARKRNVARLRGDLPAPDSLAAAGAMCPFAPRCPDVMPVCRERDPRFQELTPGHFAACFLHAAGN
jgi:oligopeptide/dipeptide ABC transporter ATP-binding protein